MNSVASLGLRLFLRFFILYLVFTGISLVPSVGASLNGIYSQSIEKGFQALFPKAYIRVAPEKENHRMIRVEYASKEKIEEYNKMNNRGSKKLLLQIPGSIYKFKFYNLFLGFYVLFLALMFIPTLPWKERLLGLFVGSILFYLYSFFKASLTLFILFNKPEAGIYNSSPQFLNTLKAISYVQTLGVTILVVLLIWAALVFRKGNWKTVMQ